VEEISVEHKLAAGNPKWGSQRKKESRRQGMDLDCPIGGGESVGQLRITPRKQKRAFFVSKACKMGAWLCLQNSRMPREGTHAAHLKKLDTGTNNVVS